MILRYVSLRLFSFANCIRRARCATPRYFQRDVLITNPRFRGRVSLSLSLTLVVLIVAEKAFHDTVENALYSAQQQQQQQQRRPIIYYEIYTEM